MKNLMNKRQFLILAMIILLGIVITLINSNFLSIANFVDMAKGNAIYGIMALGMTCVLITGGIDLSIPGNITLCSVVCGLLLTTTNLPGIIIVLLTIAAGALVGVFNGLLVTKLKLPAMVITLGTNSIVMGSVLYFTKGNMITGLPKWFSDFGVINFLNIGSFRIPVQVLIYILALILIHILLKYNLIGRGYYAIGGNAVSASRVGYNVDRLTFSVFILNGALVGLAAFVNTSILQSVNPNTYYGIDMTIISIAVLGGASILGGIGSALGSLLGTVLMAFINNGLILARVPTYWQNIVMGAIILIAITVDVYSRKREQDKLVKVDVEE